MQIYCNAPCLECLEAENQALKQQIEIAAKAAIASIATIDQLRTQVEALLAARAN